MSSNAEIAIGVICACLPALSVFFKNVHENSTNKRSNYASEYGLQDRSWSRHDRSKLGTSKSRIMTNDGSDEDILVSHAQANPKIETSVHAASGRDRSQDDDGIGITKTVDVSTSVSPMK